MTQCSTKQNAFKSLRRLVTGTKIWICVFKHSFPSLICFSDYTNRNFFYRMGCLQENLLLWVWEKCELSHWIGLFQF